MTFCVKKCFMHYVKHVAVVETMREASVLAGCKMLAIVCDGEEPPEFAFDYEAKWLIHAVESNGSISRIVYNYVSNSDYSPIGNFKCEDGCNIILFAKESESRAINSIKLTRSLAGIYCTFETTWYFIETLRNTIAARRANDMPPSQEISARNMPVYQAGNGILAYKCGDARPCAILPPCDVKASVVKELLYKAIKRVHNRGMSCGRIDMETVWYSPSSGKLHLMDIRHNNRAKSIAADTNQIEKFATEWSV